MKRFLVGMMIFSCLLVPTISSAFMSWGTTGYPYLEYKDFERNGDGYNLTLVNKSQQGLVEFYVIVQGTDINGNVIYRQRFFVDFIPGNGQISYFLPGYNKSIFEVRLLVKKVHEEIGRAHV